MEGMSAGFDRIGRMNGMGTGASVPGILFIPSILSRAALGQFSSRAMVFGWHWQVSGGARIRLA